MCVCLCARRKLCVQLGIGLPANILFVHWYVLVVAVAILAQDILAQVLGRLKHIPGL